VAGQVGRLSEVKLARRHSVDPNTVAADDIGWRPWRRSILVMVPCCGFFHELLEATQISARLKVGLASTFRSRMARGSGFLAEDSGASP